MATRALALDLGSSSVRAIVFESPGPAELAAVPGALSRRPRHLVATEPGQATFDATDYLADLIACLDELKAAGSLEGVSDVALDSQWHSLLAVDREGRAATDVISWADTRPAGLRPEGPDLTPEALEDLRQRTGCAFAPMYWTWRVPWLTAGGLDNAGEVSFSRFLGLSEYVGLQLLGDPSMSVSMASGTGLLATTSRRWDEEALELAGVGPSSLPELASPRWEGRLSDDWRQRWPELAAARWHPAMGDGAAANLGVGCDGPRRAAITIGTSAAVRAVSANGQAPLAPGPSRPASPGPPGPVPTLPHLPAGLWRYCVDYERVVTGAAYSSGGQLYAWALALWEGTDGSGSAPGEGQSGAVMAPGASGAGHQGGGAGPAASVMFDIEVRVAAGSEGVLVLPWHGGTRPPAPLVPAGQGAVVGLGFGHSGAHIVSAAVEAVCFQLAGGLADLEGGSGPPLEVIVNGGAVERSTWWRGRLAATLGRRVLFSSVPETTARGAVAAALGVELGAGDVVGEEIEPAPADVTVLAHARRRWADWYGTLLPLVATPAPASFNATTDTR
jgi:gluconokinase